VLLSSVKGSQRLRILAPLSSNSCGSILLFSWILLGMMIAIDDPGKDMSYE
jgi:hypothetical protein